MKTSAETKPQPRSRIEKPIRPRTRAHRSPLPSPAIVLKSLCESPDCPARQSTTNRGPSLDVIRKALRHLRHDVNVICTGLEDLGGHFADYPTEETWGPAVIEAVNFSIHAAAGEVSRLCGDALSRIADIESEFSQVQTVRQ